MTASDNRSEPRSRHASLARAASTAALALAVVWFALRGPLHAGSGRLWDYAVCTASASLWIDGSNPYDAAAVAARWHAMSPPPGVMGEVGWLPPVVPPWTLALLAPFAAVPQTISAPVYLALTLGLTLATVICCGRWAGLAGQSAWQAFFAAALACVPVQMGLSSGNPATLAATLAILGGYRSRDRDDDLLAGLLFGFATAAKVQVAGPIVVVWWCVGRRRTATIATAVALAVAIVGVGRLLGTDGGWLPAWLQTLSVVNAAGGSNDFANWRNAYDLVNLQPAFWYLYRSRPLAQLSAVGWWAALGGLAIVRHRRRRLTPAEVFGVAAVLSLMPVYHRTYDAFVILPAAALAVRWWGDGQRSRGATVLLGVLPLVIPATLLHLNRDANDLMRVVQAFRAAAVVIAGAPAWGLVIAIVGLLRPGVTQKNPLRSANSVLIKSSIA